MKMHRSTAVPSLFARWFALLAIAFAGAAMAQQEPAQSGGDPPARVGTLTASEGSVVFAPAGETDWTEAPRNRPITRGDRLWTDEGARAEVHFGSSVVHMDSRTFVEVIAIDDDVVQLRVNEGSVNARVREMRGGDNFEIDTPNLALRVTEPGEWRMDIEPQQGFTRVAVRGGTALAYGAGGGVQQVAAGRQMAFAGRDLAQLANPPMPSSDAFERWAMDRNRAEDQSVAARHIPRDVVGYQELDSNGTWAQDATYGAVWYPQTVAQDWAPYRYGRWEWIAPWGWTWIDDAPWGFAPFHYGRWTTIGSRWAWVPGPIGRRPVYAPALVAFVGGNDASFSISSGPGIGWYPLAPGEIWQPFFAASPVYVRNVNRYVVVSSRSYNTGPHRFLSRPEAITAVRIDDFNRGRHVTGRWSRVSFNDVSRARPIAPPAPSREYRREQHDHVRNVAPPVQRWSPPAERREFTQRPQQREEQRQFRDERREVRRDGVREERGAVREQWEARDRQAQQLQRQQQDAQRQDQESQQRRRADALRQQQDAQRQVHEAQQRQRVEAVRQQQAARQQQEAQQRQQASQAQQQQRQEQQHQQRAWAQQQQQSRQQAHQQQQVQQQVQQQQVQQQRREERQERRDERGAQRQAQRDDEGRGNGRGHRWQ